MTEICCVINCNNRVMYGDFGLKHCRYGYCQIHKIEGTVEETTLNPKSSHQTKPLGVSPPVFDRSEQGNLGTVNGEDKTGDKHSPNLNNTTEVKNEHT